MKERYLYIKDGYRCGFCPKIGSHFCVGGVHMTLEIEAEIKRLFSKWADRVDAEIRNNKRIETTESLERLEKEAIEAAQTTPSRDELLQKQKIIKLIRLVRGWWLDW